MSAFGETSTPGQCVKCPLLLQPADQVYAQVSWLPVSATLAPCMRHRIRLVLKGCCKNVLKLGAWWSLVHRQHLKKENLWCALLFYLRRRLV